MLVAAYANRPIPELAETTLSFAQKLLTLDRLRERDVLALHHRMRTGLMDDLVSGIGTERELDQRMRQYGLDPERPYRVAVLVAEDPALSAAPTTAGRPDRARRTDRPSASRAHDEERILRFTSSFQESVDDFLSRHGLAYLTVPKGDAIVVLVQFLDPAWTEAERTISALADAVERTLPDTRLRVGVSGPASGPAAPAAPSSRPARRPTWPGDGAAPTACASSTSSTPRTACSKPRASRACAPSTTRRWPRWSSTTGGGAPTCATPSRST